MNQYIKRLFNKYNNNITIKNGVLFTLFAGLNNGISFLLMIVLSIYLPKEDFGVLNLFNVLILIFGVVISLGTQSYFSVSYFRQNKDNLIKILNTILLISIAVFVGLVCIITLFSEQLYRILEFNSLYQFYALLFCLLQIIYTINLEVYRLEEKPIKYGLFSFLFVILNLGLTLFFCISLDRGWRGRADAQVISAVLLFFISVGVLYRKGFLKFMLPSKIHFKESLLFGLPLIPHASSFFIRQGLDRYILNVFHGAVLVANFSFVYTLAGLVTTIGTAFNATNSVFIYKNLQNNVNQDEVKLKLLKQTKLMTIVFAGVTIAGFLLSYAVIYLFIPKYTDSIPLLFPMFATVFFQCIYLLFVNYLFFYNKTIEIMCITFTISVLHFIISFLLTRYSILFTAYLGLFSMLTICLLVIFRANKVYPILGLKSKNAKSTRNA